jgi:hypothetical protein
LKSSFDTKIEQNTDFRNYFATVILRNQYLYANFICKHRVDEGVYINQSLKDMRDDIAQIMKVKTKDTVFYSPLIYDQCLDKYCVTNNCFKFSPTLDQQNRSAGGYRDIIGWVQEKCQDNEFDKNILICVFGVFDIGAQNYEIPLVPTMEVPYIDINTLKLWFSPDTWLDAANLPFIILGLYHLFVQINYYREKPDGNNRSLIDEDLYVQMFGKNMDKLHALEEMLKVANNTNNAEFIGYIKNILSRESKNPFFTGSQYGKILAGQVSRDTTENTNYFNEVTACIENLINSVNNYNASSYVGTLEYVDQFSKLNTVNVLCSLPSEQIPAAPSNPAVVQPIQPLVAQSKSVVPVESKSVVRPRQPVVRPKPPSISNRSPPAKPAYELLSRAPVPKQRQSQSVDQNAINSAKNATKTAILDRKRNTAVANSESVGSILKSSTPRTPSQVELAKAVPRNSRGGSTIKHIKKTSNNKTQKLKPSP